MECMQVLGFYLIMSRARRGETFVTKKQLKACQELRKDYKKK